MKNDDKKPIEGVANRVSDDADALPIAEENIDHANKPISKGRGLIASLLGGDFSNFTERLMTRSNRKVVEEKARYARSKEELDNATTGYLGAHERAQEALERHNALPDEAEARREAVREEIKSDVNSRKNNAKLQIAQSTEELKEFQSQQQLNEQLRREKRLEIEVRKAALKDAEKLKEVEALERQADLARRKATAEADIKKYEKGVSSDKDRLDDIAAREAKRFADISKNAGSKSEDELAEEMEAARDGFEEERRRLWMNDDG